MKTYHLLMVVLSSGAALTCFYLVDEYLSWQSVKATNIRAKLDLRQLYKKVQSATTPYVARAIRRK
jgi:hypothetical protein